MRNIIDKLVRIIKAVIAYPILALCGQCTTVVAGRKASAYGTVLIGHNEDNRGNISSLNIVPRLRHAKGSTVRFNGGGVIEQAGQTWSYLWSEIPGQTYCDFYLNEWGVIVTSNSAESKEKDKQKLRELGLIRDGGIDYWLRRIVAERAKNAREGLDIAAGLLDRFGYNDQGRMYIIADKNDAWILNIVAGRTYCARKLPDDHVTVIPNTYILGEVDFSDGNNYVCSPDIVGYAVSKGWFHKQRDERFVFGNVFGASEIPGDQSRPMDLRQWTGHRMLLKSAPETPEICFSVKAEQPVTADQIKQILRSHDEMMPDDRRSRTTPHHGSERCICYHDTKESIIIQNRADLVTPASIVMWKALGRPCLGIYTPFYLCAGEIPCGYGLLSYDKAIERHFDFQSSDAESAWDIFNRMQRLAEDGYPERYIRTLAMRERYESIQRSRIDEFEESMKIDKCSKESHEYEHVVREVNAFTGEMAAGACEWAKSMTDMITDMT